MAAPDLSCAKAVKSVYSDGENDVDSNRGPEAGVVMQELDIRHAHTKDDIYTQDGSVDLSGQPSVKAKSGGWRACPYILGNECCERLAYYGIGTNLVVYLTDVLQQGNARAATNVNNWSGTCYITPLIGGFIADAFIGRYWTIAAFSTVYFIGMALLTLSAAIPSLKPPSCLTEENCAKAKGAQIGVFWLALYMVALGTGGIKPCVSSLGADQFDVHDEKEKKRKSSVFNWFYFSINIGALISASVLVYIQDKVSWAWGFGVPAAAMAMAIVTFFIGTPKFRHQKPRGSPLTRVAQVLVAYLRKWNVKVPSDGKQLYEVSDKEAAAHGNPNLLHSTRFKFLDKAATPSDNDLTKPKAVGHATISPWKLTTVTQVEEVKLLIYIFPIWATSIVFSTVYSQMTTLFVEQGAVMNTHMGPHFQIPPASLSIFDTLSVIMWVPVYDRLLVPLVRRYTGNVRGFTQLQRMGIGLLISILAMMAAAVVEILRLKTAKRRQLLDDPDAEVPISIFWQTPQYSLIGAGEVFTFIGQLEFFYDQAPASMRSLLSALSLTTVALGNFLSSLLVTIVTHITTKNGKLGWIPENLNRGHLDYFFWLLAILSAINLVAYMICAKWYKYKYTTSEEENQQ